MPAIQGPMDADTAEAVKRACVRRFPARLRKDVVVNRLLDGPASNIVSVRSSVGTDPDDLDLVIATLQACGVTVQPFTRPRIGPRPKIFGFVNDDEFRACQQTLAKAGIAHEMLLIPSEVSDLFGNRAPYLEAYCEHDDVLQRIEDALRGKTDIEVYYRKGMIFVSKAA